MVLRRYRQPVRHGTGRSPGLLPRKHRPDVEIRFERCRTALVGGVTGVRDPGK